MATGENQYWACDTCSEPLGAHAICPDCWGDGVLEHEDARREYASHMVTCPRCDGQRAIHAHELTADELPDRPGLVKAVDRASTDAERARAL